MLSMLKLFVLIPIQSGDWNRKQSAFT